MSVFKLIGIAIIATAALMLVRSYKPELALPLSVAAGVVILFSLLDSLSGIKVFIDSLVSKYGLNSQYIKVVFKVVGIAYLAQFASQICKDSGEGAMAGKVELVGRIMIITVSIPAIASILDVLSSLFKAV
ncbi:MAG: stage III sporulation protein AD [Clostridia bacterium]